MDEILDGIEEGSGDEGILDWSLGNVLVLIAIERGLRADVRAILAELERELAGQLAGLATSSMSKTALAKAIEKAQGSVTKAFASVAKTIDSERIARQQAAAARAALAKAYGVETKSDLEAVVKAVKASLVEGAPLKAWTDQQAKDAAFRFERTLRTGIAEGKKAAEMASEMRAAFPGIGRNADILVRTAVARIAADARMAFWQQHRDLIEGFRQISTLDSRTSLVCIAYADARWDVDLVPIKPNKLAFAGGCPRHWGCRSVIVPYTDSGFRASTKAAEGGPVRGSLTFAAWLDGKPKGYQDKLLGPGRAQLWRDGKITLQQLVNESGRVLTLPEVA